jgi:imidazolonepropionase-like amidohydrolase
VISLQNPHALGATLLAALLPMLFLGPTAGAAPIVDDDDDDEETEDEAAADEDDVPEWLALVGGDVHTGTGEVLRGATVLCKDGVIDGIGYDLFLPEEAEVHEVRGMRVYPGLVAISATSRLMAGGFMSAGQSPDPHDRIDGYADEREDSAGGFWEEVGGALGLPDDETRPVTRTALEDGFDPFSSYLVLALATGITSAQQQSTAIKLKRGEIEGVEMRSDYLVSMSYSTRNPSGMQSTREKFAGAQRHLRELREWEIEKRTDKEAKEPSKKGVDSNALAVLMGEKRAQFSADERTDLLNIARLAQEFGFRPVINGCVEGWTVADELGRAGAIAVIVPRARRDKPENLVRPGGSSIENAAILHRAGVQVAVAPSSSNIDLGGITGRDLLHLPIEAGFAVRGGLPEHAALAALTIVPARSLGVDDRVGAIEVGKDADLIVTDGDVLHYETFVQWAVVAGKVVYDKQEELFFAHIRPRPSDPSPDEVREAEGAGEGPEEDPDAGDDQEEGEADEGDPEPEDSGG